MPNWCENILWVNGDPPDIQRFKADVRTKKYDLQLSTLLPIPEELEATAPLEDKPNWYDWCIKNWGTRGDVEGKLTWDEHAFLEFFFLSAFNPPVPWLKNISKKYPPLLFRLQYYEPNIGFMGVARAKNGKVNDKCFDST